MADTPGFELSDQPKVQVDHKKCKKLHMPRNHTRVHQTSLDMLQSWRGNCDVQILIYDSDPRHPNISEIARVTDYVVAYSCKGNHTHLEEVKQNKELILRAEDLTGDKAAIIRVSKQVMNEASKKRMISKQECMVLLGCLDLVLCSETISNVSISSSTRLRKSEGKDAITTFVQEYTSRPLCHENTNMNDYFHIKHNNIPNQKTIIPSFVGVNGNPVFPVTDTYARHVLIVYRPWRAYPKQMKWISEFEQFINLPGCPMEALMPYRRVMLQHITNMTLHEPKTTDIDHSKNPISMDDKELIELCGLSESDNIDYDTTLIKSLPRGEDHKWDKKPKVRKEARPFQSNFHLDALKLPLHYNNTGKKHERRRCHMQTLGLVKSKNNGT